MNSTPGMKFQLVTAGLVIASMVLSWVLNIVFGGFKIGRLARSIQLAVPREQLAAFMDLFQRRVAELGFRSGRAAGEFLQGGSEFLNLSSHTHAKTRKQLKIIMHDGGAVEVAIELTLQYLDPIVGDTGECAYRDAVLAYVSGQADLMKIVPNRSFAAFSSFTGGLFTWAALFGLKAVDFQPLMPPMLVLGITYVILGIVALVTIGMKPAELKGIGLAIGGMIASGSALVLAVAMTMARNL